MEMQVIITIMLTVIGFLVAGLYNDMKIVKKLAQDQQVTSAKTEIEVENLKERVSRLESKNGFKHSTQ